MNEYISYLIESGASLVILFAIYFFLLRKETYFGLIRGYLILSIAFSFTIPMLHFSGSSVPLTMPVILLDEVTVGSGALGEISSGPGLLTIIFYMYIMVSAMFMIRLLGNLYRIVQLIRNNKVERQQQYKMVYLNQNLSPFSFFNYIFINSAYLQHQVDEIIEHENAHIKQLHSLDILFSELLIILQWFNPIAWMYRKTLSENHEFLADQAVLRLGYNLESYQVSILSQLFGIRTIPATNNFNKSITRKRLNMMKRNKSSQLSKLKLLLVIPVAGMLFLAIACSTQDNDLLLASEADIETLQEQPGESLVYFQPDEMAEYPGGFIELRKFVAVNLKYPEKAKENGVQGKVYIQFVVDEEGKIIPVSAEKGAEIPPPPPPLPPAYDKGDNELKEVVEPAPRAVEAEGIVVVGYYPPEGSKKNYSKEDIALLKEEAIRVVKTIPPFEKPAMVDGKPVKSLYTFPINFVLQ